MNISPMKANASRFRLAARKIALGGAIVVHITGAFPVAAQQASLTSEQCQNAISISTQIMTKYRGQISDKLAASFGQFRDSKCDLSTPFTRVEGTADEKAFGEFRVKLIAIGASTPRSPEPK